MQLAFPQNFGESSNTLFYSPAQSIFVDSPWCWWLGVWTRNNYSKTNRKQTWTSTVVNHSRLDRSLCSVFWTSDSAMRWSSVGQAGNLSTEKWPLEQNTSKASNDD